MSTLCPTGTLAEAEAEVAPDDDWTLRLMTDAGGVGQVTVWLGPGQPLRVALLFVAVGEIDVEVDGVDVPSDVPVVSPHPASNTKRRQHGTGRARIHAKAKG